MKKYIIFDQVRNGDLYTTEFDNISDARKSFRQEWEHMSNYDKQRRETFYLMECDLDDEWFNGDILEREDI